MNKWTKKALSMAMVGCMTLQLAACGGEPTSQEGASAPGTETAQSSVAVPDSIQAQAESTPAAEPAGYVFTPGIFSALHKITRGVNNEFQLTDAVKLLMASEAVYGCRISGKRYDLGSIAGFIAANVEFALRRPELQEVLGRQIINILKEKNIL